MAEIENLKIGNGTIHIVGNQDIVADSWEAGKTYVADRSYVIREHILYVCNTTHTSVEPFDPTKWTATTIGEALGMAGSANVIECTLAEYTAWKAGGLLINETTYILTDAPNLNATSEDLSYDGGATSTHDVIEGKADKTTTATFSPSTGITVYSAVSASTDKQAFFTGELMFSGSANTWVTLGTLSIKPTKKAQVCGVDTSSGAYMGIVQLDTTGDLKVYPIQAISGHAVGFSIAFA